VLEGIQPPSIFANSRPSDINDGVQKRHGFREHSSDVLAALIGHLTQARVRIGVDVQCAADNVHCAKIAAERGFVEMLTVAGASHWICKKNRADARLFFQRMPGSNPGMTMREREPHNTLLLSFTLSASRYTLAPISLNLALICAMPCSLSFKVAA